MRSYFIIYRFLNDLGELLYVGSTTGLGSRLTAHMRDQVWWPEVVDIKLEYCATHALMLLREREAIAAEHPRYSSVGTDGAPGSARHEARKRYRTPFFIELVLEHGRPILPTELAGLTGLSLDEARQWLENGVRLGCLRTAWRGHAVAYTVTDRDQIVQDLPSDDVILQGVQE